MWLPQTPQVLISQLNQLHDEGQEQLSKVHCFPRPTVLHPASFLAVTRQAWYVTPLAAGPCGGGLPLQAGHSKGDPAPPCQPLRTTWWGARSFNLTSACTPASRKTSFPLALTQEETAGNLEPPGTFLTPNPAKSSLLHLPGCLNANQLIGCQMNLPSPLITMQMCPELQVASGCLSGWNRQHLPSSRSLPASTAPGPLLQEAFLGVCNSLASLTLGTLICKHHALLPLLRPCCCSSCHSSWGSWGLDLGSSQGTAGRSC